MKLQDIYRDVYSKLNMKGLEHDVYYQDIIKCINDAIRQLRQEYVINDVPNELVTKEEISLQADDEYNRLNSGTLSNYLLEDVPINFSIVNTLLFKSNEELKDEVQTFTKGGLAYKGNKLYQAVKDIDNENTYDSTFSKGKVRPYKKGNGLLYHEGDIIYDKETKSHYKVNDEFIATSTDIATNIPELDEMYWKEVESKWLRGGYIEFNDIDKSTITDDDEFYPFVTAKGNTIYSNKFITKILISYIPKWIDVEDYEDDVNLPDTMIPQVKQLALAKLLQYFKGVENVQRE